MKKTSFLTLLVASILLTSCGKSSEPKQSKTSDSVIESEQSTDTESVEEPEPIETKQTEIIPEEARQLFKNINDQADVPGNFPDMPDEFAIETFSIQSVKTIAEGTETEESFKFLSKMSYSKTDHVFYREYAEIEDGKLDSEQTWMVVEDDAIYLYIKETDKNGVEYKINTLNDKSLDEFISEFFIETNSFGIQETFTSSNFEFTKTPICSQEKSILKYDSYYGSNNKASIQLEEFMSTIIENVSGEEIGLEGGTNYNVLEDNTQEVNILNNLLKSFNFTDEITTTSFDETLKIISGTKYVYNFFEDETRIPEFDKTLWDNPLD